MYCEVGVEPVAEGWYIKEVKSVKSRYFVGSYQCYSTIGTLLLQMSLVPLLFPPPLPPLPLPFLTPPSSPPPPLPPLPPLPLPFPTPPSSTAVLLSSDRPSPARQFSHVSPHTLC